MADFKFEVRQIINGWLVKVQRNSNYAECYADSLDAVGEVLKACVAMPFDELIARYAK